MRVLSVCFFLISFEVNSFAQKINLQLHLSKGNTYHHTIYGSSKITETIDGKEINIDAGLGGTTSYEIIDLIDTSYITKVRYKNLQMRMKVQDKTFEFNSDATDNSDKVSKILAHFINIPFSVEMSIKGRLNKVENIDTVFRDVVNAIPDLSEEQKQKMMTQLLNACGEKAFKGNFNMMTAMFPSRKVNKGDKWIVNTELELLQAANLEITYKLTDIGDDYYQIHGESTMKNVNKDAYVQVNGMPVKYDLSGSMITNLKLSKTTGWIIEGTIKQEMKGNMEFKDTEQVPGGMIVPIYYVNDIKVSGN